MERVQEPLSADFSALRIFADDLDHIFDVLKSKCDELEISDGEYNYENIDDLKENANDVTYKLILSSKNPFLSIELGKYRSNLYVSNSEYELYGLFAKLRDILVKCEAKPRFLYKASSLFIFIIIFSFFTPIIISRSDGMAGALAVSPIILAIVIWYLLLFFTKFPNPKVYARKKRADHSFIKSNKDTIIVGVIVAFFTAIITQSINIIYQEIWNSHIPNGDKSGTPSGAQSPQQTPPPAPSTDLASPPAPPEGPR